MPRRKTITVRVADDGRVDLVFQVDASTGAIALEPSVAEQIGRRQIEAAREVRRQRGRTVVLQ